MPSPVIGLTSGIAGGKDTAASLFAQYDIERVDADEIARRITALDTPLAEEIIRHFGEEYRRRDSSLNRNKLRRRVFSARADRQWLESLLHPPIQEELKRALNKCKSPYNLLLSPLILETAQFLLCHKIIVIKIGTELQIMRACKRDKISKEEAQAIIASQMPLSEKIRKADYILDNNGTRAGLAKQVSSLHRRLLAAAKLQQI